VFHVSIMYLLGSDPKLFLTARVLGLSVRRCTGACNNRVARPGSPKLGAH